MTTSESTFEDGPLNPPTRRAVLKAGAAMAAAAGSIGTAAASGGIATGASANELTLSPVRQVAWMLGRMSFGVTPDMLQDVRARGLKGWIDWQLEPHLIDDSDLDSQLVQFDWMGQSVAEMYAHPTKTNRQIGVEARGLRMIRATHSKRQLFERLVEFWTDHFNVFGAVDDLWLLKVVDDEAVIRANALGSFADLLHASAKSPAMVEYLDNNTNVVGAPQENYAREVMELHTLGVDGPYSEDDIRELARCFTGWGYYRLFNSITQYGEFVYRPDDHDTGPKQVLGIDIPAGGDLIDAETILDHLANHPSTIDFVTNKLARWFLGYEPPLPAVEAAKATWVATGGHIKSILETLLHPRFLRASTPWSKPKLKRPLHWVFSLYRAVGTTAVNPVANYLRTAQLGHSSFDFEPPTGYPDTEEAWASLLIWRWNYAAEFSQGLDTSLSHTVADLQALLGSVPLSDWASHLSSLMTNGTMDHREIAELQAHLNSFIAPTDQAVSEAFELVASSPSFGRY